MDAAYIRFINGAVNQYLIEISHTEQHILRHNRLSLIDISFDHGASNKRAQLN